MRPGELMLPRNDVDAAPAASGDADALDPVSETAVASALKLPAREAPECRAADLALPHLMLHQTARVLSAQRVAAGVDAALLRAARRCGVGNAALDDLASITVSPGWLWLALLTCAAAALVLNAMLCWGWSRARPPPHLALLATLAAMSVTFPLALVLRVYMGVQAWHRTRFSRVLAVHCTCGALLQLFLPAFLPDAAGPFQSRFAHLLLASAFAGAFQIPSATTERAASGAGAKVRMFNVCMFEAPLFALSMADSITDFRVNVDMYRAVRCGARIQPSCGGRGE